MKKLTVLWLVLLLLLSGCATQEIPEPKRCSLCDDLSRHAPCVMDLSTGEKVELDIYEPHHTLVGEIAEEQRGGYFSFVRGAGVEGYKLGAESVTVKVPQKAVPMEAKFFCQSCRKLLSNYSGHVLIDLKDTENPVVYEIVPSTFSIRCYDICIKELDEEEKYEIYILGTLEK